MSKISITRALVELKRIDNVLATIHGNDMKFIAVKIGQNQNAKVANGSETVTAAETEIKRSFDRISTLTENRRKLKSAIVLSNATTKVKIGNQEMTVAEAIEMKSQVQAKRSLLTILSVQHTTALNAVNQQNAVLEQTIDKSLQTLYGGEKAKVDASQYDAVAKPLKEQREASLIDPCNIVKKIDALREEINLLTSELDFVLSESNAKTEIEVDLTQA